MNALIRLVCLAVAMCCLCSCDGGSAPRRDIVSQKKNEPGRTPVTVLVKYAFSINSFEREVEARFPDIDLVQVGNYTRDMGIAEYEKRLIHGDLPDIVMTWPLNVGEPWWEDRLLDLAGLPFTSRYQLSMLNTIARNGKLYYLPGPAQVRGIIYNKTLFEEKGWQVPKDFDGFLELCKTIEASGIRALQLGFANAEVLDTAFVGYNYAGFFSKPRDTQWIAAYKAGQGSFGDHFRPALEVFQRMIEAGIWKEEDLDVDYAKRERMFFTRRCAMVEDSVLMARMGFSMTGTTDQFALMPFFNPGDGDWARLYMVCYIGLNKELARPENKARYAQVLRLMEFISSPEGQQALAADTGAMFSSLSGVAPPETPEISPLRPALSEGRYAIFPQLSDGLRRGLTAMLSGNSSLDTVIKMVDAENISPLPQPAPPTLGAATDDFTLVETGSFVADVLRDWSGCDIALVLDNGKDGLFNGKGISARLYKGDITSRDIARILPDLKQGEQGTLQSSLIKGEDLIQVLEYAIPVNNNVTGWFYYFSGLRMEYDPAAPPGSRLGKLTLADNTPLDPQAYYSLAAMDQSLPEQYLVDLTDSKVSIAAILAKSIQNAGRISPPADGRFLLPK